MTAARRLSISALRAKASPEARISLALTCLAGYLLAGKRRNRSRVGKGEQGVEPMRQVVPMSELSYKRAFFGQELGGSSEKS
jgi:hypothetical protein